MSVRHVIFDFDGTSTLVEVVQEDFLRTYRELLSTAAGPTFVERWEEALAAVAAASPKAGWTTVARTPAAPANADPYIAAGEAVAWLERRWREARRPPVTIPADLYKRAYDRHPAPFRPELAGVLEALVTRGLSVTFISNSATDTLRNRLADLLSAQRDVFDRLRVIGNAGKFIIKELDHDLAPPRLAAHFEAIPAATPGPGRPIYLRRGDYFQALSQAWGQDGDPAETLVVGDVFELDLAMPLALGCAVQLIERAAPFATQPYELDAVGGEATSDLRTLLERFEDRV